MQKPPATFDLLWTNSSPSSNFSAQTIPLTLNLYDAVMIMYSCYTGNVRPCSQIVLKNGYQHILFGIVATQTSFRTRYATATNSGVTFGTGYNGSTSGTGNVIPMNIYGIKGIN